jgi:hypothetical protein
MFHSEEFHNSYFSHYTARMIKSRNLRWVGYVACMGLNAHTSVCQIILKEENIREGYTYVEERN